MHITESAALLRAALRQAGASFVAGDAEAAERSAKAISALVRAARDVAELETLARTQPPEDDEEARRAELRRRLALYVERSRAGAPDAALQRIAAEGSAE